MNYVIDLEQRPHERGLLIGFASDKILPGPAVPTRSGEKVWVGDLDADTFNDQFDNFRYAPPLADCCGALQRVACLNVPLD